MFRLELFCAVDFRHKNLWQPERKILMTTNAEQEPDYGISIMAAFYKLNHRLLLF